MQFFLAQFFPSLLPPAVRSGDTLATRRKMPVCWRSAIVEYKDHSILGFIWGSSYFGKVRFEGLLY